MGGWRSWIWISSRLMRRRWGGVDGARRGGCIRLGVWKLVGAIRRLAATMRGMTLTGVIARDGALLGCR